MAVIGVDVGGTKVALARFSEAGRVLHREVVALRHRAGPEVGDLICRGVRAMLEAGGPEDPVRAVGVAVPGIFHAERGTVWAPNIPGWEDYPLRDEVQRAVGPGVHVRVDSDRACYILGDVWQGTARGCRNAVFLAVGTGIGAGILVDGQVLRGHRDIAGAIGWMALDRPYRAEYRGWGCFEHAASGPGLARVARELLAADPGHRGPLRDQDTPALDAAGVFAAMETGDAIARRAVLNAVELWGMAVANLASLFDPEMIVLGGGVFGPAAQLVEEIREVALRWGQPISTPQVRLGVSSLQGDAGLFGAGHLALRSLAEPALRPDPAPHA